MRSLALVVGACVLATKTAATTLPPHPAPPPAPPSKSVTRESVPPNMRVEEKRRASPQAKPAPTQPAPEAISTGAFTVEEPLGVAFTSTGTLLVAAGDGGIIEFDPAEMTRLRTIAPGAPDLRLTALAIAQDGSIFAVDEGPGGVGRVVHLSADGEMFSSFGEVRAARGIAVSADGSRIAVADTGNDRVVVFERGREAEPRIIGKRGSENGRFRAPSAVVFDPAGRLFVADSDNHRVQRFGRDGTFERTFGTRGAMPGQFERPMAFAPGSGTLLVADHYNHRMQRFDEDGGFLTLWGMHAVIPREAGGRIHYPVAVAADEARSLFAVAEPFERRVQIFRRSQEGELVPLEPPFTARDGVSSHFGEGLAVDGTLMAIWEPEASAVVVFDLRAERPAHVTTFGTPGRRVHEIGRVGAIAVDEANERVWIADVANDRLVAWTLRRDPRAELRFDPFMGCVTSAIDFEALGREIAKSHGGPLSVRPIALAYTPAPPPESEPSDAGEASAPKGPGRKIATGKGELLLLDGLRGRVIRLDGDSLAPLGVLPSADMGFPKHPIAIAASPDGRHVAILDGRDPARLAAIVPRSEPGDARVLPRPPVVQRPQSIAWLSDDTFVVTTGDDRVVIMTIDGRVLAAPELHGVDDGQLWHPRGVVGASDGSFFVVDWGNHRLQRFDREGRWLSRFGVGRSALRPRMPDAVPSIIFPKLGALIPVRPEPATAEGPFPRQVQVGVAPRETPEAQDDAPTRLTALSWWPVDERGAALPSVPLRDPFFMRVSLSEILPRTGVTLDIDASMPHHGHGMNLAPATAPVEGSDDLLVGPMLFHMPGAWEIYFDLRSDGRLIRFQDEVVMEVGQ